MTDPFAIPLSDAAKAAQPVRPPQAFLPTETAIVEADPEFADDEDLATDLPHRRNWMGRLAWATGGALVSLGLGLAADRLIEDLFARYQWLGWAGVALLILFLVAIIAIAAREIWALRRLRTIDRLRKDAIAAVDTDLRDLGHRVTTELLHLYAGRRDLGSSTASFRSHAPAIFDGSELVRYAERTLMPSLDARTRILTAASARRVALVTAVSPRALVDIGYVIYESIRLAGAVAALYGARPGFFGFIRLTGAVLSHLAVTGGLVLTDGLVEQLVGQGMAARLSQRLGEGVVNGLMTVRVGIAAARVVRPLPYTVAKPPVVRDFIPDLLKVNRDR